MKKFTSYISIILVFLSVFSFFNNQIQTASAAVPTMEVGLKSSSELSAGKWYWVFNVDTKNAIDNTPITIVIKKAGVIISTKKGMIANDYYQYQTDPILESKTSYTVYFTLLGNSTVTKTFTGTPGTTDQKIPPTILTFFPVSEAEGNAITITGSNFTGLTHVLFGTKEADLKNGNALESDGKITVSVPLGTTDGKITVKTSNGVAVSESIFKLKVNPVGIDGKKKANTDDVYKLLAPIGDLKEAPVNIGDYFNTIIKIAIGLCGALAVIMIVLGGIQYMGDESIFSKTEAKSKITASILGLLIALGSYALLNTINPDLLGGKGVNIKSVSAEIDEAPILSDIGSETPSKNTFADCPGGTRMVQTKTSDFRFCSAYANNLQRMIADADAAGYTLSGGGFRSLQTQISLRNANCPNPKLTVPATSCKPQTALPGTSNHEQGLAVDLACNGALINWDNQNPKKTKTTATKTCFDWLKAHEATYGFKNLPAENWHWSVGKRAGS